MRRNTCNEERGMEMLAGEEKKKKRIRVSRGRKRHPKLERHTLKDKAL